MEKSVRAVLSHASSRAPQSSRPIGGGDQHIRQQGNCGDSPSYPPAWAYRMRPDSAATGHGPVDNEQATRDARSSRGDRRRSAGRHRSTGQARSIHVQRGRRRPTVQSLGRCLGSVLLGLSLSGLTACAPAAGYIAIDGDTLKSDDGDRVRLIGINAPEIAHSHDEDAECLADEAHARLADLIDDADLTFVGDSTAGTVDKYGRDLAYVEVAGRDVGAALIRDGYARAVDYGHDHARRATYAELQAEARNAHRGIWGECG